MAINYPQSCFNTNSSVAGCEGTVRATRRVWCPLQLSNAWRCCRPGQASLLDQTFLCSSRTIRLLAVIGRSYCRQSSTKSVITTRSFRCIWLSNPSHFFHHRSAPRAAWWNARLARQRTGSMWMACWAHGSSATSISRQSASGIVSRIFSALWWRPRSVSSRRI